MVTNKKSVSVDDQIPDDQVERRRRTGDQFVSRSNAPMWVTAILIPVATWLGQGKLEDLNNALKTNNEEHKSMIKALHEHVSTPAHSVQKETNRRMEDRIDRINQGQTELKADVKGIRENVKEVEKQIMEVGVGVQYLIRAANGDPP